MEFSHEWKSLWPISSVHALPLLLQSPNLGPLFFNPNPKTLRTLYSSRSFLSPPLLPPPPSLSLSRFLTSSTSPDCIIIPSTANTIAAEFIRDDYFVHRSDAVLHSRLESLKIPGNRVLVFFPTGKNLDRVGFLLLKVKDSKLVVDSVFKTNVEINHRIVRLCASPVEGFDVGGCPVVGFLFACSLYAVHWFAVKIKKCDSDELGKPALVYLGSNSFKSCGVAHACWNPHFTEECVVLLESGEMFLFNMKSSRVLEKFVGKDINVPWNEMSEWKAGEWFSCEFSWHPRILVVANARAVYVVDMRFGKFEVKHLVTIESLSVKEVVGEDRFVAFSKAGDDRFSFAVASEHWLLLCDIRRLLAPVLRWAHNLHEPRYMTSLPLSVLRSQSHDDKYARVSDMGFAIILGSLWTNDFSIFCYGNPPPGTIPASSTKVFKLSNPLYAWELPSLLSLSGQDCFCGDCLLMEEFAKEDLPEWIEWQCKKELVIGFFILDKELSSFLPKPGELGGFTLIQLMSSGKLESQQYCASWKLNVVAREHEEAEKYLKDSLLSCMGDWTLLAQKYLYLRPENLCALMNENLAKILFLKWKKARKIASEEKCSNERFMTFMSEKLKSLSCKPPILDLSLSDIFGDVVMPTSLFEIVHRVMWIRLPMHILEAAFPVYTEVNKDIFDHKKAILEFPVIPEKDQSPLLFLKQPSRRSNRWSSKVQPSDEFVGPVLPLPAISVIYEIGKRGYSFIQRIDDLSPEKAFALHCKSISCLTKEIGIFYSRSEDDKGYAVSLNNDSEETWTGSSKVCQFLLYEASSCPHDPSCPDIVEESQGFPPEGEKFNLLGAKVPENEKIDEGNADAMKPFDGLCPIELKYNFPVEEFRDCELFKTELLKWHDASAPYQGLCVRLKPQQQDGQHCGPTFSSFRLRGIVQLRTYGVGALICTKRGRKPEDKKILLNISKLWKEILHSNREE